MKFKNGCSGEVIREDFVLDFSGTDVVEFVFGLTLTLVIEIFC